MVTAFQVGDSVIARVNSQGLVEGREYLVQGLVSQDTYFGNFVKYQLEDEAGNSLWVTNGHLLLDKVKQAQEVGHE